MSKYIKLEDAIHNINLEVTGRKEYTGDMKANLFFALDDLPTIEVSEDCISRSALRKEMEMYGTEITLIDTAPSVIPQVPSEDCISREYLKSFEYINKGDFNSVETIREWIDNAPSVTTEQSSLVRCKDCKHWNDFYSKCTKWTVDTYEQAQTNADDFCSYGMKG